MLTDREILAINDANTNQPLSPFIRESIGSPSYGLSCHGYDIRLSNEFYRAKKADLIIDPWATDFQETVGQCFEKEVADHIVIGPGEFMLAASLETFSLPEDIAMELMDKSTLARLGLQVFNTIGECSWEGILVLELFNNSPNLIRLHAGMAIAQAVFYRLSSRPMTTYKDRRGKYMNQGGSDSKVTLAK
jgi:dCTP deaminase